MNRQNRKLHYAESLTYTNVVVSPVLPIRISQASTHLPEAVVQNPIGKI